MILCVSVVIVIKDFTMPTTYKLTVTLEKDGTPLPGYAPLIRRLTVDQSQSFDEALATGGHLGAHAGWWA